MKESTIGGQKVAAILLMLLSLAVCVLLAVHWTGLEKELQDEREKLAQSNSRSALATLDSVALPPNRTLSVCNNSPGEITISALVAFYWDANGKLRNFNSARNQWHTWPIRAGEREQLSLTQHDSTVWDGSAFFYAIDMNRQGKDLLLSGTSDDLKNGCIPAVGR
jgi:hypothetical protein